LKSCHSSVCTPPPLDVARRLCSYLLPPSSTWQLCNWSPAIFLFAPLFHPTLLDECASFNGALSAHLAPLFDPITFDDSFPCALHPHVRFDFVLRALHPCSTQFCPTHVALVFHPIPDYSLLRALHPYLSQFFLVRIAPLIDSALSCALCTRVRPSSQRGSFLRVLHLCSTQLPTRLSPMCLAPLLDPALSYAPCTPFRTSSQRLSPVRFAPNAVNPHLERNLRRNVVEQNNFRFTSRVTFLHNWIFPLLCLLVVIILTGFFVTFLHCSIFKPPSILSLFPYQNTQPWHLRAECSRTLITMSCVIRLLFPMPTLKNTRLKPSIEVCWKCWWRWRDVNFKCFKKTWKSVVVDKSYRLNEPSWKLCKS
jgi:hypothetical protein